MKQEQRRRNDQKRQVAIKLVSAPEHQGTASGNLNDSHLCYFSSNHDPQSTMRVIISVKYVDRGKYPGIGVYFESDNKHEYLPSLEKLQLPLGFYLDVNSTKMRSATKGWVVFCKDGCKKFNEMYEQIVKPGDSLNAWKSLYEKLKAWLKDTFGWVGFFDKECLAGDNLLTSESFTTYS